MWNDTKETRGNDSQLIVFLNDENKMDASILEGFKNYYVDVILWSEREKHVNMLRA